MCHFYQPVFGGWGCNDDCQDSKLAFDVNRGEKISPFIKPCHNHIRGKPLPRECQNALMAQPESYRPRIRILLDTECQEHLDIGVDRTMSWLGQEISRRCSVGTENEWELDDELLWFLNLFPACEKAEMAEARIMEIKAVMKTYSQPGSPEPPAIPYRIDRRKSPYLAMMEYKCQNVVGLFEDGNIQPKGEREDLDIMRLCRDYRKKHRLRFDSTAKP